MGAEGEWWSTGAIAEAIGQLEYVAREAPPYNALWGGRGRYGRPCCQGCTDPAHLVTRSYEAAAEDIRPHLKALERAGRIRCAGKHASYGQAATFFWYTTDKILAESA